MSHISHQRSLATELYTKSCINGLISLVNGPMLATKDRHEML